MLGAINSFNSKRNVALCSPGAYSFVGISDSKKKKKNYQLCYVPWRKIWSALRLGCEKVI